MIAGSSHIVVHDYAGHAFPIDLSLELAKRGYRVSHIYAGDLVTPRGSLSKKEGDPDTLEFFCIPIAENYHTIKYSYFRRWLAERNYGKNLCRMISELNPDVVLSGNTPSEPQWRLTKLCARKNVRMVAWIQDFYSLAVYKILRDKIPILGPLIGNYYKRIDRNILKECDAIVSITPDFVPILISFGAGAEKIETIPNWAPICRLPMVEKSNSWSRSVGIDGTFNFIYSGTLALKHNPEIIVALAMLFKEQANAKVVVISEGPGIEYIESRLKDSDESNVLLLPFQKFEDLPKVLGSADVLIGLLEEDAGVFSVPSKILSYLCSGKPLLTVMPEHNLASRILIENDAGIVIKPQDKEGILKAAVKLRENLKLRMRLGENGRKYAEENFAIRAICDEFERVLISG